jgi:hypothetical protein
MKGFAERRQGYIYILVYSSTERHGQAGGRVAKRRRRATIDLTDEDQGVGAEVLEEDAALQRWRNRKLG